MSIDAATVAKIARLARLKVPAEEQARLDALLREPEGPSR